MAEGFDRGAAVTRSMLGWGVVAGPWYVLVGLLLALTRPGFDLRRHALSLLALGEHGWWQRTNLVLTGLMVLVAAVGAHRAGRSGGGRVVPVAVAVFGGSLLVAATALPDPVAGFPVGVDEQGVSGHGVVHLAAGAVGFLALGIAALADARWRAGLGERAAAVRSRVLAVLVLGGFLVGAATATTAVGTLLLWVAVLAGFTWLAPASVRRYAAVPHPVLARRTPA